MGEAKRRKEGVATLRDAASKVSSALRRLATAASASYGTDCFMHAEFGRLLMADFEFKCVRRSGFAAWRVGPGDGDVISHSPNEKAYLPPGQQGMAYHSWLEVSGFILDFTTYQLRHKAESLDALDGNHTTVEWCPDFLLIKSQSLMPYRDVAQAPKPPAVYYESRPAIDALLSQQFVLDQDALAALRLLIVHPEVTVMGPNSF